MRRQISCAAPLALTLLAACAAEPTAEEQAAEAARKTAQVEKGNAALLAPSPVTPEPIAYADIEEHGLTGAGCNFAPGTSFATRLMARADDAYMKVNGEMVRFAADSGAPELGSGIRDHYFSKSYELRLQLTPKESGGEEYDGTVLLLDEHGRLVYQENGLARCEG